jgi:hypothetical protein
MPQHYALWGLAFLALVFAPGAEALKCGVKEYLHFDGSSALTCTACPGVMTNVAGVTGGYGDSADPRISKLVAAAGANSILTYCNVPAGSYLSTSTSATAIGAATSCPTDGLYVKTTSVEQVITGAETVVDADHKVLRCSQQSKCAVDEYLSLAAAGANVAVAAPICTACPGGMTALVGSAQPPQTLIAAVLGNADAVDTPLTIGTYCNVPAGSYLSSATSVALIGAAADCGNDVGTYTAQTTSVAHQVAAIGTTAVDLTASPTSKQLQCTKQSLCAANEYLSLGVDNTVTTCTSCPTNMIAASGSSQGGNVAGLIDSGVTAAADVVVMGTFCSVSSGYYLSTAATANSPGAVTACDSTDFSSTRSTVTLITSATAVQNEYDTCIIENSTGGPAGAAGPAGPAGAAGTAGTAGTGGTAGTAGSAGSAGSASPAAPLSSLSAAILGAVVPAVLILV